MKVGDKIYFAEEKRPYTVQACNERYLVCTKPFNIKHTVLYTLVDLEKGIRGADWCWKWGGQYNYQDKDECEMCLKDLISGEVEISYQNVIKLNIWQRRK